VGGTTAAAFLSGTLVEQVVVAANHNDLAAAIVAVETRALMLTNGPLVNGSLSLSVSGNALTVALKTAAGSDASSTDPVRIRWRSATAANGDETLANVTAALSVTVSSGSTLGASSSTAFRVWIVAFNDGGTIRLGVINCRSGTTLYPLAAWGIASSTAEGGSGGADSAQVFYTGTAVTSKAYVVLGYATWESGLGTAGTWSSGPTRVELFTTQTPLPGRILQIQGNASGASATGTTVLPTDDTIPQNTEGDQYITQAITPTSAANLLSVDFGGSFACNNICNISAALFQDSTAGALCAITTTIGGGNYSVWQTLHWLLLAATTSSTTFKIRAGTNNGATTTFNGFSGARALGGAMASFLEAREIMA